ncbi:ABC-2 type transport system permease protein [Glaciihabitans tibetensis]|uniref:ABC-2 type transport system permease protein n=1 Tax=Glaciihabitans tibetensis TaxID=1266600 RepID=A0A2T0VHC2_9MICO|nr:ABC transporter permease [Glaciihabitans tibetensis]PRY69473.1 ABC-2 type transport system permease protein [Glaciihabitans tibetensis]
MVAQLLRLRLSFASNALRRTPAQLARRAAAVVIGLAVAVALAIYMGNLNAVGVDVAAPILTVLGSAVCAGFVLTPVVYGRPEALDPRSFSLMGVDAKRLSPGLALAALVSVPALALAIVAFAQVATWNRESTGSASTTFFAVAGALLITVGGVLGARVVSALVSFVVARRRSREFSTLAVLVVLVAVSPVVVAVVRLRSTRDLADLLTEASSVLGWTPLGAAWAAPAAAAAGSTGEAVAKLLIALVSVALLGAAWHALVARMLVTAPGTVAGRPRHGLGWFGRFPGTPAWAVAARTLSYWGRDPRYAVSLAIIPIVPVVLVLPLLFAGVPAGILALIPVPVAALLLGWTLHNDVAYDNTAIWLHITSGIRGAADRFGRAIPTLVVGIPFIAVGALASAHVYGDRSVLPSLFGVGFGILFTGVGVSSIVSARFPYPVAAPGSSAFTSPQTSGSSSPVSQTLSFAAILALCGPALYFAGRGLFEGGDWPSLALSTGIGGGLFVLLVGVFLGGWIFERRSTDLFAFSVRN